MTRAIHRRGLLKAILFAPAVVHSVNLMALSWRSSKLLGPTSLNFGIDKTIVRARSRKLNGRWTYEGSSTVLSFIDDDVVDEIAMMLRREIDQEALDRILERPIIRRPS